jgi:hypothetical protein
MRVSQYLLATFALVLLAKPVAAQIGTGTLTGKVVDASTHKPLADVVVTATSPALQGEQTVVTDASGLFRIPTLPPGEYSLRYETDTFRPYSRGAIELRGSVTLRVDAELLPDVLKAEEVTITAKPPTVDVGSARTGVTIDSDFTSRLPVAAPSGKGGAARSFEQLALIAPTGRSDTYGSALAGTTSPENQFILDGMSVGDPGVGLLSTPLSIDFIKETNIITGGYLPEYGRGGGGVFDVVTKSGSNEFHGSVFGNDTPWSGSPTFPRPQDTISTTSKLDSARDFGFDLGGPLVKDKLWFYIGADTSKQSFKLQRDLNLLEVGGPDGKYVDDANGLVLSNRLPGTSRTYLAEQSGFQYIGKLTFSPTANDRLELIHHGTPTHSGGDGNYSIDYNTGYPTVFGNPYPGTALTGPYSSMAWRQIQDTYDTSLKWTHSSANKKLTFDTIVAWHNERTADLPSDGSGVGSTSGLAGTPLFVYQRTNPMPHSITDFETLPNPALCVNPVMMGDGRCPAAEYDIGGPQILQDRHANRYQARELVTFVTPGLGHHIIKAGAEIEYMTYDNKRGYPGGSLFAESAGGTNVSDLRRYGAFTGPDDNPSNTYTLNSLHYKVSTLSVGAFLQDSWSIMDKVTLNAGLRYDAQSMYADQGLGLNLPNQLSPRIGVIFDPTQQGRAKLFANYAIYFQTIPLNIMDRAGSGEPQIRATRPLSTCDPVNTPNYPRGCDASLSTLTTVDPSFSPNQQWRYQSEGRLAIDPNLHPQSTSEFSAGGEYELIPGARIGLTYIHRWLNNIIEDMSRDEGNTFFLGNPGSGIASDFPKATRTYDAGILSLTKLFSDNWLAQASYTLSYTRGNWEGLFRSQTGQLDPGTNSDFDIKSLLINRSGPLDADRRHEIKVYLAREIPLAAAHHINIGASYRATSGGPTNFLGYNVTYGPDEVFLLPRGDGERLPWVHTIDLHLGYTFLRTPKQTVQFTVDVFNLFNFQAITKISETYTSRPVQPIVGPDATNPFVNGNRKQIDPTKIQASDGELPAFSSADRALAFGSPTVYQDPITIRFGVKGSF